MNTGNPTHSLTPIDDANEAEVAFIQQKLHEFNLEQTNGAYDQPGIEINLVLRDPAGTVVGGVNASTMLRVMYLEALWVADEHREQGYGSELVLAAEQIGLEKGCVTSQTWSLSFQAPEFYQKIGYEVLGVYKGYPYGITETVLKKKLQVQPTTARARTRNSRPSDSGGFSLTADVTQGDMQVVHEGLGRYVHEKIGDKRNGIAIRRVIRDSASQAIGVILGFTTIGNLIVEHLWVDARYRGLGLGRKLVLDAERAAQASGCIAAQTYALSFQAPGFWQKLGYKVFGVSDGFPYPIQEFYFIKKFNAAFRTKN